MLVKKKFKQNPVERALGAHGRRRNTIPDAKAAFCRFLETQYGFTDIRPVIGIVCNTFFTARDGNGQRLFIKTGTHRGIYENEFLMTRALYAKDNRHFLEPLYYNDHCEFNFVATKYVRATSLATVINRGTLTAMQKLRLIRDLHRIFIALRESDVVHRDIRPDNFMIYRGRLILIDFQLAVSKSNYIELEYMREHPRRLRNLGGADFQSGHFEWDDAYSLLQVLKYIGRMREYGAEYDAIYHEIKRHIGKDKIKSAVREGGMHRLMRHMHAAWARA